MHSIVDMDTKDWDDLRERNRKAEEEELQILRSKPFAHHMPDILPIAREAINQAGHLTQRHLDALHIVREFAIYSRYIPSDVCNFITLDRFLVSGRYVLYGIERVEFEMLLDFIDEAFVELSL